MTMFRWLLLASLGVPLSTGFDQGTAPRLRLRARPRARARPWTSAVPTTIGQGTGSLSDADLLSSYDPDRLAAYFARHPLELGRRAGALGGGVASLLINTAADLQQAGFPGGPGEPGWEAVVEKRGPEVSRKAPTSSPKTPSAPPEQTAIRI